MSLVRYPKSSNEPRCARCRHTNEPDKQGHCTGIYDTGIIHMPEGCGCKVHTLSIDKRRIKEESTAKS